MNAHAEAMASSTSFRDYLRYDRKYHVEPVGSEGKVQSGSGSLLPPPPPWTGWRERGLPLILRAEGPVDGVVRLQPAEGGLEASAPGLPALRGNEPPPKLKGAAPSAGGSKEHAEAMGPPLEQLQALIDVDA